MPGKSKKGGGLEVGSAYKMKNPILRGIRHGSPMQANYGSPAKHTSSRGTHMRDYGKDHTNEAHPDYWNKDKIESDDGKGTKKANQLKDFLKKSRKGAKK
jgi:hypothetical protein